MIKLLENEVLKLKKLSFILCLLIVPLLGVIFGTINYYMNVSILKNEWISLWTQVYMIYGLIFLPVLVGIIIAFVWQSEHKKSAFKILLTSPVKHNKLIISKIIVSFLLVLITQVYFFILFLISGSLFIFDSALPFKLFLYLIILTLFILTPISFQGYISIKINSFVLPVGIALVLSIFSLIASSQDKIPFLRYVFAQASLTTAMNHYPDITYTLGDWISMVFFSASIFLIFYIFQILALKRKFK